MLNLSTPKIKVEIVYENGDSHIKKYPIFGNKVIIEPAKRGRGGKGWSPTFERGSIIEKKTRKLIFKVTEKRLMIKEGSDKCVNFASKQNEVNIPTWDRKASQDFFDVAVLRQSGDVKIKHELPLVFWLLLVLGIINLGISLRFLGVFH